MYPKRTAPAKAKGRGRGSNRGRDNRNKGTTRGSKKRQRPQEQPKSQLTSGGNRHRPRRRSFSLSDTEIDMGAFSALQAKRVSWSTLARRPQLNRVHTVNAADIPSFVQKIAGKSLKGQAPEFFQLQRPDPEASSCVGFGHSLCLLRHSRKSACSHGFGQFVVSAVVACSSSRHSYLCSFDMQRAPANMAETHAGGRSRSFAISRFWDKKAINWLRCNRWVGLIDTDKNLGTALVGSQWIEDQVQIWLNKMTRHIGEAEASQKIIAGAQTLGTITERAIESEVIEEKAERFFFTFKQQKHNCTFLSHPRKDSPAANLQQAHWQLLQFLSRNSWCLFELLPSACGQELQACHWFVCSHHWLGWDSSGRGARHHVHFRH